MLTVAAKAKSKKSSNTFSYLETADRRMRFNNSKDPLYHVFAQLEDRSLNVLVKEFVQDSFFEVTRFVSKITK